LEKTIDWGGGGGSLSKKVRVIHSKGKKKGVPARKAWKVSEEITGRGGEEEDFGQSEKNYRGWWRRNKRGKGLREEGLDNLSGREIEQVRIVRKVRSTSRKTHGGLQERQPVRDVEREKILEGVRKKASASRRPHVPQSRDLKSFRGMLKKTQKSTMRIYITGT